MTPDQRGESGRGSRFDLRRTDVRDLLADAIERVRPGIVRRGHALTLSIPPSPLEVRADEQRLTRAFAGLLDAAGTLAGGGGEVDVRASPGDGTAVVVRIGARVPEKGSGAGASVAEGPPAGAGKAPVDAEGNVAFVRGSIEAHRGTLETEDAPGPAGTFVVRIPALAEVEERERTPTGSADEGRAAAGRPTHRPLDLLVVDDHPDMAHTLETFLELLGHRVRTAGTGREALERIGAAPPDIVFMDIGLPDIDGFEVARRIRASSGRQRPLLVAMTGYSGERERRRALRSGFDHHLVKPLEIETVRRIVRHADVPHSPDTDSSPES